jgi:hypothetical protein
MNRMIRLFALMGLCFALIAGSVTMAVARGHATALTRGGVTLVLCSGFGYRTVSLDARGTPMGPSQPCPDCLAGLAAVIPPGPQALPAPLRLANAVKILQAPAAIAHAGPKVPRARGPPQAI